MFQNHNIDKLNGSFKSTSLSVTPKIFVSDTSDSSQNAGKIKVLVHGRNVERPQIKFKIKVDNRPVPFKPLLNCKPNSKIPLDLCLETNEDGTMLQASYFHSGILYLNVF